MQKKVQGFTILEFVILILIIDAFILLFLFGINPSLRELRDTRRQASMQTISLLMRANSIDRHGANKYLYASSDQKGEAYDPALPGLREIFSRQRYRTPESFKNICYFLAMGEGSQVFAGSDNQFAVVVWGETTSTVQSGTAGVLAKGIKEAVEVFLKHEFVSKEDFSCGGDFFLLKEIFREVGGERTIFLFLDSKGKIREL